MTYLFWLVLLAIGSGLVYWIMDWKQQHPNGE